MGHYWLGIDIGGTFTDFTLFDTATQVVTGLTAADLARLWQELATASGSSKEDVVKGGTVRT